MLQTVDTSLDLPRAAFGDPAAGPGHPWYALWTASHCEQLVHDQLAASGLCCFLPKVDSWSKRRGVRRLIKLPMFPGYLFVRHAMDKDTYVQVRKIRGVVALLGERWDRLAPIPDAEIEAIRTVADSDHPVLPYPYLKEGQRARLVSGPLSGLEGILVESRPQQGVLVLSVHLLQRSVAVAVDVTDVVPA